MPPSTWQVIWDGIIQNSGLAKKYPGGNFTGHCMRRGAAQWRFGECPVDRWAYHAVCWWGGWVEGETVGSIARYLLENLIKHERDYGDMMNPLRDATCRSLQTTYEDIRPAKTADIKALHRSQKAHADMLTVGFQREMDRLIAMKHDEDFERATQTNSSLTIGDVHGAVESLLQQYGLQPIGRARPEALSSSSSSLRPVQMQRPTPTSHLIRQPDFTENLERRVERMLSGTQAASMPVLPMVVPIQVEDEMPVLRLRRCGTIVERARPDIPKTTSVRDALRQWFLPNSHAQAPYALQDWPTEWYMRARTPADTAVLMVYSQRARLGEAYSSVNEGSTDFTERGWDVFKQRYPQKTIMKTVTAIRAELAESGKITARTRSK